MAVTFANFKNVSFKNILVFKDEFTIPLSKQGIISVIGVNKDTSGSNGAGKSTIFDILRAIHIGKLPDGTPDINFLSNKGSSFISYKASYGKNTFEVTKYRGDKVYKNNTIILKNDKPVGAKKNAVALRKEISDNYIKIPEAVWDNCIVLRKDGAHTLLQGTPSERMDFISNLCQLNVYDEVCEQLKEQLSKVNNDIDSLRETQALYADVSRSLGESSSKKELEQSLSELEEKKESLVNKVNDKIKLRNDSDKKANKLSSMIKLIAGIEKYPQELLDTKVVKEKIQELKSKEQKYRNKISECIEHRSNIKLYNSLRNKFKDLNAPDVSSEELKEKIESLKSKIDSLEPKLEKAKEAKRLKDKIDSSKEYDIDSLNDKLNELNTRKAHNNILLKLSGHKYDKCPICERALDSSLVIDRNALNKELEEISNKISSINSKISETERVQEYKEQYNKIKEYKYSELNNESESLSEKLRSTEKSLSKVEKAEVYKTQIDSLKKKLKDVDADSIEETLTKYNELVQSTSDELSSLSVLSEKLEQIKQIEFEVNVSWKHAEKEYKKYLDLVEKYETEYQSKNNKLKKLLSKIGESKNSLKTVTSLSDKKAKYEEELSVLPKLEKKKKFLEALVFCYSNKGLKASKIEKITEALSIRLKEYTSILFTEKDIDFEIKPDARSFSMMCIRKDSSGNVVARYDAKRLSSGERARFILSLVFALDDITSPNQRCNFKVLDEIDANLDRLGKRTLLEKFIPILKAKCDTLFIVSHDDEIRNSNIFDKELIVTKQNGKSTIKLKEVSNVQNR